MADAEVQGLARRRYISTKISLDKVVNEIAKQHSDFAALLYTWGIPHAEDDCTIKADPDELLMQIFPGRRDKSVEDVEQALTALADAGLILWDRQAEIIQYPMDSFYTHQTYIAANNRRTANIVNNYKSPAKISANKRRKAQIAVSSSLSSSSSVSISVIEDSIVLPTQITDLWNEICGSKLPKVDRLTDKRKQHLKARCQEPGRDEAWWRDYFSLIIGTPFLTGDNDRGWRADFDFATKSEDSVVAIQEGKYIRVRPPKQNKGGNVFLDRPRKMGHTWDDPFAGEPQ